MPEGRVQFTIFKGPPGSRLTKAFTLGDEGEIFKVGAPLFSNGVAETRSINRLSEIQQIIEHLGSNACIATGIFNVRKCEIVTTKNHDQENQKVGTRSRSKENMCQPSPGLVLFDHDANPYMPERLFCLTPANLMANLANAIPELVGAAYSGTTSCSHGIKNRVTGEAYPSGGGLHVYAVLENGQVSEFRRYLEVKQWNGELGFIAFGRNGAMLPRTLIDISVFSPERLIYEARPVLGEGLAQAPREWHHHPGKGVSGDFSLTDDEIAEYKQRVADAKADPVAIAEAERLQERYHGKKIQQLAKHAGITEEAAAKRIPRQSLADREHTRRDLSPDDIVEIGGEQLTITELLARGAEFDNTAMPDPVEGGSYGATTAKFYWNQGRTPCIHSFAHGVKTVYWLNGERGHPRKTLPGLPDVQPLASFDIDQVQALDPGQFPHIKTTPTGTVRVLSTLQNVKHMLTEYDINLRYNVYAKQYDITMPGLLVPPESFGNTALTHIQSLAALNGMAVTHIPSFVNAIAAENQINPVADWICSRPWDGKDRLPELYATLVTRESFPIHLKETLIYRWLLSAVAAALMSSGFHSRGALILQGPQSIGKTTWFQRLVDDPYLQEKAVLLGHNLDPTIKDSLVTAICHWIVEIGEFESTMNRKKDIGRLKGLITNYTDKLRRLYDRGDTHYPRKTVFCASVNDEHFLIDATGNTRWWVLPVVAIDYKHEIDMQQVFAQLKVAFESGEPWWLTREKEAELERQNRNHRAVSAIEELVLDGMDPDLPEKDWVSRTPIEILRIAGIKNPTNWQCKECAAVLRDHYGEPKKIQGYKRFRLPLRRFEY